MRPVPGQSAVRVGLHKGESLALHVQADVLIPVHREGGLAMAQHLRYHFHGYVRAQHQCGGRVPEVVEPEWNLI